MSLCALRQAAGLRPTVGCLTTVHDMSPTPLIIETPATAIAASVTPSTSAHSPLLTLLFKRFLLLLLKLLC